MTEHPAALAKQAVDAVPATLTLAVEEMHCGACLRSVERAAMRVPGVDSARASLARSGDSTRSGRVRTSSDQLEECGVQTECGCILCASFVGPPAISSEGAQ